VISSLECGDNIYTGASIAYKEVPFFRAVFQDIVGDEDYVNPMDEKLLATLGEAELYFIETLWLESEDFAALKTNPFGLISTCTALLPYFTPGYLIYVSEAIKEYLTVIVYYNTEPLASFSYHRPSLEEEDSIRGLYFAAIKDLIVENEKSMEPVLVKMTEILSKPARKRNHYKHLRKCNMIGDLNERVTRSKARRA
jgi:hypothetical protein